MTPDQAAEMLQIPERGKELLALTVEKPEIQQALSAVVNGFEPRDVAEMFKLPWDESEAVVLGPQEGAVNVWQCTTPRCMQKGKVATATEQPDCPSCSQPMEFYMAVDSADQIAHMVRVTTGRPKIEDPLSRTDRTKAPGWVTGGSDADD